MTSKDHLKVRQNDIVLQELKGELLIYDLQTNRAFCLNQTSALVWYECDGEKSFNEISQTIGKKLNTPTNDELVWLVLDELRKNNLLANDSGIARNFNGMSRRQVLRKVGLASLVALPLISSFTAPSALAAQSACVLAGLQATATASNTDGQGLLTCLSNASKKCCNVPPFAFQSSGPNICDGFSCSCTFDCM